MVTGHLAGTATITASFTDTAGNDLSVSCVVYVTVPDGLYYLKNASSGLYLQDGDTLARTFSQETDQTERIPQLWKIAYIGYGNYCIRPIEDLSRALYVLSTGSVGTDDAPVSNTSVESLGQWMIQESEYGYSFKQGGLDAKTMTPIGTASNSYVTTKAWSDSAIAHWELEEAKGIFLRDDDTHKLFNGTNVYTLEIENTFTLDELGITLETYGNGLTGVSWIAGNSEVAAVNSVGDITTLGRGKISITVNASANGVSYSHYYTLIVRETVYITNLYDSTIKEDEDIIENISKAVTFLNTVYNDTLYLYFEEDGDPQQYANAPVDICPNEKDSPCDRNKCEDKCKDHHKNLDHIGSELFSYKENMKDRVVVLWSNCIGSIYCRSDDDGENCYWQNHNASVPARSPGNSATNMPVIQFLTINNNRTPDIVHLQDVAFMSVVLAHEIAHTLLLGEVSDDYYRDDYDHDENSESEYCIMNGSSMIYQDIYNGHIDDNPVDILCEYCTTKLWAVGPKNAYEVES